MAGIQQAGFLPPVLQSHGLLRAAAGGPVPAHLWRPSLGLKVHGNRLLRRLARPQRVGGWLDGSLLPSIHPPPHPLWPSSDGDEFSRRCLENTVASPWQPHASPWPASGPAIEALVRGFVGLQ